MAERLFDNFPDTNDHCRVDDVPNLDVNRVEDEHGARLCKRRTITPC
jgi:hypothetical protein